MYIHDIFVLGESDSFEIKTREEVTVNLELEKAPSFYHTLFTGKVLCKDLPIRNATVMVLDDRCSPLSSTITDENGIFKFCNILKPGKYKVISSAIGYSTSDMKAIIINQNEVTKLSVTLKKSLIYVNGIVYGKILEAGSRKPIEDADIYLKSTKHNGDTIYKTTSNHNGQYMIYNILPNKYEMVIQKQGYMEVEPLVLEIEKHNHVILYFDLIRSSNDCNNTISGIIKFKEKSISKVPVFLYLLDKQENEKIVQIQETNENGFFLFSNIESGSYLVKGKLQNSVIYENPFTIE